MENGTPSKNELTTDEILFSRRGSGLLTTLASAGGGNDAPGGGGSNKGRDWSGLPEEVALAILDDESERKKESLLSILEESSAKFKEYLETRPEGWGPGLTHNARLPVCTQHSMPLTAVHSVCAAGSSRPRCSLASSLPLQASTAL